MSDATISLIAPGAAPAAAPGPGRQGSRVAGRRAAIYLALAGRCVRISSRSIDMLLTALMLPVVLMLLFVYVFGGALRPGGGYVSYLVPGVLLLCAGFGAANTAVTVCQDMTGGIIDRFRSMDVSGRAMLAGHVTASVARNLLSTALVLAVAVLIGFRPHATAAGWIAAGGILVLFVLAISWLAAAAGLLARSAEAASGLTFGMMFLPYPSATFVPIATMPGWLQGFARNQPVTPVVRALRGLLLGLPAGSAPWLALAWCGGIVVVAMALSGVLLRWRTR